MILIWRGMGLLVILFALAGPAMMMGLRSLLGYDGDEAAWLGGGLMLAAGGCIAAGIPLFNARKEGKSHDLYFIPVLFYGPILLVAGVLVLVSASGSDTGGSSPATPPAKPNAKQNAAATPADPAALRDLFAVKPAKPAEVPHYTDVDQLRATNDASRAVAAPRNGVILRPAFDVGRDVIEAGTAFPVALGDTSRTLILSALHLLGPAGGLDVDVPPEQVPKVLRDLVLRDAFTDADVPVKKLQAIALPDSAPLGKASAAGDLLAMWIDGDSGGGRAFTLADKPLVRGDDVYLAARVGGDRLHEARLHRAIVSGFDEQGNVHYAFDTPRIELRATSGAAVLNVKGEVVAVNLGGWQRAAKVVGIGNPVSRFRRHLEDAIKKANEKAPAQALATAGQPAKPATPTRQFTPPPAAPPTPAPHRVQPLPEPPKPQPPKPPPQPQPRAVPPRPAPAIPGPRDRTTDDAEFDARSLALRLRSAALHNRNVFPASLDEVKSTFIRERDRVDPWGDAWLYFGNGKKRDIGDRSKTLLLASGKAHDGKRVVAYLSGTVETISEEEFQKLAK